MAPTPHTDGVIDTNILMESFYHSHGLHLADALIAATALEYDLTLYTRNVRHFRMIPRLTISQPY